MLRAAYACCGSYSEAEDIAQDVFLLLHAKPVRFSSDEHMKAWLLRVAINKSKNFKRSFRISRTRSISDDIAGEYSMDVTDIEVRELIENLPHKYSSVIYLHFYEGYTTKEIAEILGKNENTVSSLLQRAKAKLRSEFDRRE